MELNVLPEKYFSGSEMTGTVSRLFVGVALPKLPLRSTEKTQSYPLL